MPTSTVSVLGPIVLHSPRKEKDHTSGQSISYNVSDSRLYQPSHSWLSYSRIREIIKDPTIQLARMLVVSPMVHTPWEYKEEKNAPSGAAEFIKNTFEQQRDWLIQNAVYGALDFGWAPFELVYAPNEGQVIIREFKQLIQDYTTILVYIETGQFAGFVNEPTLIGGYATNVEILLPYAMNINLVVEGTDWYGLSTSKVLDPICEAWGDVEAAASRYDKKVAGATWVVYYPVGETTFNGVTESNDDIARAILSTLEASGTVAIPDEIQEWLDDKVDRELKGKWRIELITANATTQAAFVDRQKYLDALKIRAFGIPERAVLEGSFGTKAEAEVHGDIALSTIDTKHRLICDQINKWAVWPLMRMNYGKKYEKSIYIQPAPLVDAQFQTVKEVYRLLVQSPEVIIKEVQNIDVQALRDQIGVPTVAGAKNDFTPDPVVLPQNNTNEGEDDNENGSENGSDTDEE